MAVTLNLKGTNQNTFKLGIAGPIIKNNSGEVQIRNTADSAYADLILNTLTVTGDLTVEGTTTIINTQTLEVADKNIEIGKVDTPSDTTADGGGIILKGSTNKTILWDDANDNWTSSEHFNLVTDKSLKINNVTILTATALGSSVTASSLTSVGTIGTGVWQGTVIGVTYGGTGAADTATARTNLSVPPLSRAINTSNGLTGGGDLSSDRTLMTSFTVNAQTGTTYTILNTDRAKVVTFTNGSSIAVTLPQAGASSEFVSGWMAWFQNRGAGSATITPTTSTIDGAASITLDTDQGISIFSDGTNYFTSRGRPSLSNNSVTFAKMQDITTQRIIGRNTGGSGDPEEITTSQAIDWIGSTRGSILYRGASGWAALTPGTAGTVLTSGGAGADPSYAAAASAGGGSGAFNTGITKSAAQTVGTTPTTIYTTPSSTVSVVYSLKAVARTIDCYATATFVDDSAGATFNLAKSILIRSGTSVELLKKPKVLETADLIQVAADIASGIDYEIAVQEYSSGGSNTFKNAAVNLSTTSATTVYTAPSGGSVIESILLVNSDGSSDAAATIEYQAVSASSTYYLLGQTVIVPAKSTIELLSNPIALLNGRVLRATAVEASKIHVIVALKDV